MIHRDQSWLSDQGSFLTVLGEPFNSRNLNWACKAFDQPIGHLSQPPYFPLLFSLYLYCLHPNSLDFTVQENLGTGKQLDGVLIRQGEMGRRKTNRKRGGPRPQVSCCHGGTIPDPAHCGNLVSSVQRFFRESNFPFALHPHLGERRAMAL